ncbi:glycosyltransferase family 9 protein [Sporomusa aerivorans]|uniref:glycosyltransferase family 9 protein n=1 Tax=Sporomusa aerivorans TaxID=204936 RepID=UPI00352BBFA1
MKNFLVINTSYFGDVLLTDTLCQNIKTEYPDSRIVFLVNKPFYEAARYLAGVDEVICLDKQGKHRGLWGIVQFLKQYHDSYPLGFDAAFVLYGNERGLFIAKVLGARQIISENDSILHYLFSTIAVGKNVTGSVQQANACLLTALTGKMPLDIPMQYRPPTEAVTFVQELFRQFAVNPEDKLIGLCTTSKKIAKDMPVATAVQVIADLNRTGQKAVLLGAGVRAAEYAATLRAKGCTFLDLTDKTSIAQLAAVIQKCKAVISVDTGTLHLTCALGVPLLALFYLNDGQHLAKWAPAGYYPHVLLAGEINTDNIQQGLQNLLVMEGESTV